MKLTYAKEQCARCEKSTGPLVYDSTGRLVCKTCYPVVERRNADLRSGERRRSRRSALALVE